MYRRNFAHRGFSGLYPENTMLAFEKAVQTEGCDGIENDIQLTKDGIPVIIHDERTGRTCKDGFDAWVKDLTLAELKALDVSYRFDCGAERIPTLEEYLDFMRGNDLVCNLELKTGVFEYRGIEEKVLHLIKGAGMTDRVIISSFNHYSVLRMKALAPEIACGLLSDSWLIDAGAYVKRLGCEYYHPSFRNVTPKLAGEILSEVGINTWTVNEEEDIKEMFLLGVDSVIGNFPDRISRIRSELD